MIYGFRSTAVEAVVEDFKEVCDNVKAAAPVKVKYHDDNKVSFECPSLIPGFRNFFRALSKTLKENITIVLMRNGNTSCTFRVTPNGEISEVNST